MGVMGGRYDRLSRYLNAMDGTWGCQTRYDDDVVPIGSEDRWPALAGHYTGLLRDFVKLIGRDRLLALADIMGDIETKPEGGK